MLRAHLEEHAPAAAAAADVAEAPDEFRDTGLGADRIAHRDPRTAMASVHQERVAAAAEQQVLVPAQHEVRVGMRRTCGDGGGALQVGRRSWRQAVPWDSPDRAQLVRLHRAPRRHAAIRLAPDGAR
jgi:hypothetical protein